MLKFLTTAARARRVPSCLHHIVSLEIVFFLSIFAHSAKSSIHFAQTLCTKKAQSDQWPDFGAKIDFYNSLPEHSAGYLC
jgi:hypothetical protein